MSITQDTSTNGGQSSSGSTTHSFTHTCTGSNLILIVSLIDGSDTNSFTSVTYNGVAMTQIGTGNDTAGYGFVTLWGLLNPTVGSHDVSATRTATGDRIYGGS